MRNYTMPAPTPKPLYLFWHLYLRTFANEIRWRLNAWYRRHPTIADRFDGMCQNIPNPRQLEPEPTRLVFQGPIFSHHAMGKGRHCSCHGGKPPSNVECLLKAAHAVAYSFLPPFILVESQGGRAGMKQCFFSLTSYARTRPSCLMSNLISDVEQKARYCLKIFS